ncbi:hypothetical protein NBRC116583_14730 [Arenicella sp. 4NH20-0111]|uniref:hypothetical protein n=1 Tax=Arenicella sp. 4NH20-0111 TaxID=3127648 RepID=UPI00310A9145
MNKNSLKNVGLAMLTSVLGVYCYLLFVANSSLGVAKSAFLLILGVLATLLIIKGFIFETANTETDSE